MELKPGPVISDNNALSLLIVPYGIETIVVESYDFPFTTFNRTLWN